MTQVAAPASPPPSILPPCRCWLLLSSSEPPSSSPISPSSSPISPSSSPISSTSSNISSASSPLQRHNPRGLLQQAVAKAVGLLRHDSCPCRFPDASRRSARGEARSVVGDARACRLTRCASRRRGCEDARFYLTKVRFSPSRFAAPLEGLSGTPRSSASSSGLSMTPYGSSLARCASHSRIGKRLRSRS